MQRNFRWVKCFYLEILDISHIFFPSSTQFSLLHCSIRLIILDFVFRDDWIAEKIIRLQIWTRNSTLINFSSNAVIIYVISLKTYNVTSQLYTISTILYFLRDKNICLELR